MTGTIDSGRRGPVKPPGRGGPVIWLQGDDKPLRRLAIACFDDFERFCYDGFGVMLTTDQIEAYRVAGPFGGPRGPDKAKYTFFSGGQRSGKTVMLALAHADACMYKRGVDSTDRVFKRNYPYKTLAIAPSNELTLKLYLVMAELSQGVSDAQLDQRSHRSRGGRFLKLMRAGKDDRWPVVRFESGSQTDFRSSEGRATRLEGGQWWGITWDEWASQPDREIAFVLEDVLLGRSRDHDVKIWPAAWPKAETERHLMAVLREIESGRERIKGAPKQVVYLSAETAHFTNQAALAVEREIKDEAQWQRTVLGRPAGGSSMEFKLEVVRNMVDPTLPHSALPDDEDLRTYRYLNSWDLGLAHDDTVGISWRIPRVGVATDAKARIVGAEVVPSGESQTLDGIAYAIIARQRMFHADTAVDATGLGGIAAFRQLRNMNPPPIAFTSTAHHRIWGNMRLAAITNALEMMTWGRDVERPDKPWGLIESPDITMLIDQLAYFDRDAADVSDDWVWAFLIGAWYVRRYWVLGEHIHRQQPFDTRMMRR